MFLLNLSPVGRKAGGSHHFATLSPGHYMHVRRMINCSSFLFSPPPHVWHKPSPVLYLPAKGTRPLTAPEKGSHSLPGVSINLSGRQTDAARAKQTPSHTTWRNGGMNQKIRAFFSVIVCKKTPSGSPGGDPCGDM